MPSEIPGALTPTVVAKPNQRYAASFLSTKFRQYAVNGEFIKDDSSGEIFFKRKSDGKILSFFQNKKYLNDVALELRVLLSCAPDFIYPKDNDSAFFLSTNYDLTAMNEEVLQNIWSDDITIPTSGDDLYQLKFALSCYTNGFFIEVNTRDVDKPLMEILSTKYNDYISTYSGTDSATNAEVLKYATTDWPSNNCTITYTATVKNGSTTKTYTCEAYTRVNEHTYVALKDAASIDKDFPDGYTSIIIQISKIEFGKVHFCIEHASEIGSDVTDLIEKYNYESERLEVHNLNVFSFLDDPMDFIVLGNEFICSYASVDYIKMYMAKMATLITTGGFVVSEARPDSALWPVNGCWAEILRYINKGKEEKSKSDNSEFIKQLDDSLPLCNHSQCYLVTDTNRASDLWCNIVTYTMIEGYMVTKINRVADFLVTASKANTVNPEDPYYGEGEIADENEKIIKEVLEDPDKIFTEAIFDDLGLDSDEVSYGDIHGFYYQDESGYVRLHNNVITDPYLEGIVALWYNSTTKTWELIEDAVIGDDGYPYGTIPGPGLIAVRYVMFNVYRIDIGDFHYVFCQGLPAVITRRNYSTIVITDVYSREWSFNDSVFTTVVGGFYNKDRNIDAINLIMEDGYLHGVVYGSINTTLDHSTTINEINFTKESGSIGSYTTAGIGRVHIGTVNAIIRDTTFNASAGAMSACSELDLEDVNNATDSYDNAACYVDTGNLTLNGGYFKSIAYGGGSSGYTRQKNLVITVNQDSNVEILTSIADGTADAVVFNVNGGNVSNLQGILNGTIGNVTINVNEGTVKNLYLCADPDHGKGTISSIAAVIVGGEVIKLTPGTWGGTALANTGVVSAINITSNATVGFATGIEEEFASVISRT